MRLSNIFDINGSKFAYLIQFNITSIVFDINLIKRGMKILTNHIKLCIYYNKNRRLS